NVTAPRVDVRSTAQPAGTQVTVSLAPAVPHTVTEQDGQLLIRFAADTLDADTSGVVATPLLAGAQIAPPSPLVLRLGPAFDSYRAAATQDGGATRLTIDLLAAETDAPAEPTA